MELFLTLLSAHGPLPRSVYVMAFLSAALGIIAFTIKLFL